MTKLSQLKDVSVLMLNQLADLVTRLGDHSYSEPLQLLSQHSIGKHVRHVLEMYDEMLRGVDAGTISYDARKRNAMLEENRTFALKMMNELKTKISQLESDKHMPLIVNFSPVPDPIVIETSIGRELAYNIEHAVHHMAIIGICVRQVFVHVEIDATFGVAISTLIHQQKHVHPHLHS